MTGRTPREEIDGHEVLTTIDGGSQGTEGGRYPGTAKEKENGPSESEREWREVRRGRRGRLKSRLWKSGPSGKT